MHVKHTPAAQKGRLEPQIQYKKPSTPNSQGRLVGASMVDTRLLSKNLLVDTCWVFTPIRNFGHFPKMGRTGQWRKKRDKKKRKKKKKEEEQDKTGGYGKTG